MREPSLLNARSRASNISLIEPISFQSELAWINWSTVQNRVREAQPEHHMCVHKQEISDLDIYHRILRYAFFFFKFHLSALNPYKNYSVV